MQNKAAFALTQLLYLLVWFLHFAFSLSWTSCLRALDIILLGYKSVSYIQYYISSSTLTGQSPKSSYFSMPKFMLSATGKTQLMGRVLVLFLFLEGGVAGGRFITTLKWTRCGFFINTTTIDIICFA